MYTLKSLFIFLTLALAIVFSIGGLCEFIYRIQDCTAQVERKYCCNVARFDPEAVPFKSVIYMGKRSDI